MTRVLVVGDTALDHYLVVSAGPDEKPVVRRSQRCLGGTGANAAVAAARLGAEVTLATRLGSDPIADWLAAALDQTGLRATHIERADGDSMLATIIDDGVRRQVFVDPGVGIDPGLPALESEPACIYLSYATAATADLLTRGTEALVVVGVEHWMLSDPELLTVLDGADLVVTNAAGWDSWVRTGRDHGCAVVVTRGAAGAELRVPGESPQRFPAPEVDVVDATGAGDAFAGALVRYLATGCPAAEAVRRAVVAGAIATTGWGAQAALATETELDSASGSRLG